MSPRFSLTQLLTMLTFGHRFAQFFDTPRDTSAAPAALGFDGFFKGAYSYHFHNFWWVTGEGSVCTADPTLL